MTATSGLESADASKPAARSIARAGARVGPSTISRDGNPLDVIMAPVAFWIQFLPQARRNDREKSRKGNSNAVLDLRAIVQCSIERSERDPKWDRCKG